MGQQEIREEILRTLLRDILKDGQVEDFEKEAVQKLFPLLKISRERYKEIYSEVKEQCAGEAGDVLTRKWHRSQHADRMAIEDDGDARRLP